MGIEKAKAAYKALNGAISAAISAAVDKLKQESEKYMHLLSAGFVAAAAWTHKDLLCAGIAYLAVEIFLAIVHLIHLKEELRNFDRIRKSRRFTRRNPETGTVEIPREEWAMAMLFLAEIEDYLGK